MNDPHISAGEAGGLIGLAVTVMVTLGGGIAWLAGWWERNKASRAAKLDAWQKELKEKEGELDEQEATYRRRIEARMARLEGELMAVRHAFELVASALRVNDPTNVALVQASAFLTAAFPIPMTTPADMTADLDRIDAVEAARRRAP